jgi:hypothetical protein
MKNLLMLLLFLISCGERASQSSNEEVAELKEELPEPVTCTADMGKIPMNQSGTSAKKPNELTEMLKLLKQGNCDRIEISYIWTSSRGYADMGKKLVYDKINQQVIDVYTKNNVMENYSNVSEDAFISFLEAGKVNLFEIGEYSFDNTQMRETALGEKPSQSSLDGSVSIVVDHVKATAHDPGSIDFNEWSKVSSYGDSYVVRAKYKGKNAFGNTVTENAWFYIQNGKVVDVKPYSLIRFPSKKN